MDDARSRTRYRLLVAALTGAATVGSLTATGLATGVMAQAARDDTATTTDAADPATALTAATADRTVRWQERPRRTVVRRHQVVRVAPSLLPGTAAPAAGTALGGGTVSSVGPTGSSTATATSGGPAPQPGTGPGTDGAGTVDPGPAGQPSTPSMPATPIEPPPPVPPAPEPSVPSTGS